MFNPEGPARYATRHPWRILVGAVAGLAILGALYATVGGQFSASFSVPGTETQRLRDLLEERFPQAAGDSATIVVRAPAGLDDSDVRLQVESLLSDLRELPDVLNVSSPYEQPGAISPDASTALITVDYSKPAFELETSSVDALLDLRKERTSPEFQVEAGGRVVLFAEQEPPGSAELVGLAVAIVILLIAFGSVVAMGLPIVTALLALVSGFFMIGVGAAFVDMPTFTPQFAAMVGIGVGIDYSLLVVTRYREGIAHKLSVEDAIVEAVGTAGRSVVFAGFTVVIALLGLWAVGLPFIGFAGTAAALVVALAVLVSITVLPAILKLVGPQIDRWQIPLLAISGQESESGFGYRLSRLVQRAPLLFFAVSVTILLVLAFPVLDIRLGSSDAGNNPQSSTSRRAYDLLTEGFGPGFNGPIVIGIGLDGEDAVAAAEELPATIGQERGVLGASPLRLNEARTAGIIIVIPESSPQSEETAELIHRLRREIPQSIAGTGAEAFVGGPTAGFIDVGDKIKSRLPLFFTAILGLSFILLMAVFRSVLIPIKAVIMNLLSIGAAYGVLVALFQWGWFGDILGIERAGPIESFVPMMLFAVLFGLSMDYEVFLLSRIQEEYLRSGNNSEAVARGLSQTTRVISAAAAIMIGVFLSFAFSDQRVIKEFGIGLATAIFLDATLVRLILVPSIMQLLGDANWWFPRWLDRLVPHIGLHAPPAIRDRQP